MLFKVIDNDKVKILIEKNDIENFENIDFDNNSEDTKNVIAVLLLGVYEQTGLNFLNSSVLIESVKGYCDTFYVIITRLEKIDENNFSDSDEVDMYLFKLDNIEDVMDISKLFISNDLLLKCSKLYKYRNGIYLCLYFTTAEIGKIEFDKFINNIEKHYTRCKWSILNDVILNEWGTLICENIIEKIIAAI